MPEMIPSRVLLLGYPVRLGIAQQEHMDDLVREFQLIGLAGPEQRDHVPARLLVLVDLLYDTYSSERAETERECEQAQLDGRSTVDLSYAARPETREALRAFLEVMHEVDAFCRNDDLLALARPPEVAALHHWAVGEFLAQLAGQEPTAWDGPV